MWVSLRVVAPKAQERHLNSFGSGGKSRPWKRFQVSAWISTGEVSPRPALARQPPCSLRIDPREPGAYHPRLLMTGHFLSGEELSRDELGALLDRALALKKRRRQEAREALSGRSIALVFERPSTRTRISFEVAVAELGATPLVLRGDELQLSRGESVADTARVLSRYVDAIVIRAGSHDAVVELSEHATVPVISGLTPDHHPCQALADLLTLRERFGELDGLVVTYVGDGNNVAR